MRTAAGSTPNTPSRVTRSLARTSAHRVLREIATFYVEIIRGVPILVFLFYIAFVAAPTIGMLLYGLDTRLPFAIAALLLVLLAGWVRRL